MSKRLVENHEETQKSRTGAPGEVENVNVDIQTEGWQELTLQDALEHKP